MVFKSLKTSLWGIILTAGITLAAWFFSQQIGVSFILVALLLGVIIGNVAQLPDRFNAGIKTSSGLFLEIAIVFMAFAIDYNKLISLGWETILIISLTILVLLLLTVFLAKKMNCPGSTGWLVGFGTAICGSSAIAALAPGVSKDKSDIGIALAVVNLFGLLGMVAIPFITSDLLSNVENGVLIGASLHSVGNVAGAGFGMNNEIGELAVTVKLGRVALLTPALLLFRFMLPKEKIESGGAKLNLPWYLVSFVLISILVSFWSIPEELGQATKLAGNFLLAIAMAAIGLKVSFRTLVTSGKKGLVFGAVLFAIQLALVLGLIWGLSL